MTTPEERIIELETRQAFQDDTIEDLSNTIAKQQRQIDDLTQMVKIINKQMKTLPQDMSADSADEPPPPHY
ncbi:SlyX family protein [Motiliproteus sp. MSK22-1]|uniref:SlyX family protein n=1 Tax=Motiliproteus sp. MSK22-1 TaxID=1897630 RepID=UPI0009768A11|nr:SlyX family protein [Motiliproteus sp. MSK22-1]OMH30228.1 hypothetical protein BGP75_17700 [Motiliproteus sp. MSK22-1]